MGTPLESLLQDAFHAVTDVSSFPVMVQSHFAPPSTANVADAFLAEAYAMKWVIDSATGSRHINGEVASTVLRRLLPEWTISSFQPSARGRALKRVYIGP
jgi:hypothetical protein